MTMRLVEPIPAPQILVDGYHGVATVNGVAKFVFFSVVPGGTEGGAEHRVVLHLAVPIGVVAAMHKSFGELVAGWHENGTIILPGEGKTQ